MTIINLRDYYPWYKQDEFVEVSDEVAAELITGKRYEKAYERRVQYNKAQYSLDAEDGIEASSLACSCDAPEAVFDMMEQHCGLCRALNSLPEIQGRRVEAHYLLGASIQEIAEAEGTGERRIRKSIGLGLEGLKKYLKIFS